jgi:hypothetical protein
MSMGCSILRYGLAIVAVPLLLTGCGGGSTMLSGNVTPTPSAPSPTITSVSVACTPSSIQTGQTSPCSASVSGTGSFSTSVMWGASAGTISSSGILTAPSTPQTVTVTATSTQDSTKSGTARVAVTATPSQPTITSVTVSCQTPVQTGATSNCTATVTGTGNFSSAVTWSASAGSISANGVLTAPATPQSVTVTATSVQDTTKTGTSTVVVTASSSITSVTVSCQTPVQTGAASQCTATVSGTGNFSNSVTWTASAGSISAAGLLTAPATAQTVTVTATSVQDTTKSGSTAVTITAGSAIVVTVSPTTANVATGGVTQSFTAKVQNDSENQGVTWTLSGTGCPGASCGSVSPASSSSGSSVTYTSPATATTPITITLTATSVTNNTVAGNAMITLKAPPPPVPSSPLVLGEAGVSEGFGEPVIAADTAGNIDVAWINNYGPEFVRSTNAGVSFSAPLTIPSNMQDTLEGNQIQIGVDGNGHISLLWHRDLTPTSAVPNSFFSHSTDGGSTFSAETNPGGATSAQLIVEPNGEIWIIWFDQTTSNLLAVHSSDGVNFSSPTTIWTAVGNPMDLIVESGPQGELYLFWTQLVTMTNCSILFSSSMDGATFTPAATISAGAGSCNQTPSAFVDSSGNLIVAWVADGASLFFSHSTNEGVTFSAPVSIPTSPSPMAPGVTVSPNGTIYIVWETATGASFARSVDGGATFSPTPPTFVLGDSAVVDSCDNVTAIGGGNQAIVQYQRSTDGGATFSAPVTISNFTFNYELQVTIDKSGNVHVVWGVDGPPDIEYVRIPTTCNIH